MSATATIDCGMCGTTFDPAGHVGCSGCPVNGSCILACCPSCGYSMPDPSRSVLARMANSITASIGRRLSARRDKTAAAAERRRLRASGTPPCGEPTLADACPGDCVTVCFINDDADAWREHLQAYGIASGREVEVVQQKPVTVVRVDHVDLAFEADIARAIVIEDGQAVLVAE